MPPVEAQELLSPFERTVNAQRTASRRPCCREGARRFTPSVTLETGGCKLESHGFLCFAWLCPAFMMLWSL